MIYLANLHKIPDATKKKIKSLAFLEMILWSFEVEVNLSLVNQPQNQLFTALKAPHVL